MPPTRGRHPEEILIPGCSSRTTVRHPDHHRNRWPRHKQRPSVVRKASPVFQPAVGCQWSDCRGFSICVPHSISRKRCSLRRGERLHQFLEDRPHRSALGQDPKRPIPSRGSWNGNERVELHHDLRPPERESVPIQPILRNRSPESACSSPARSPDVLQPVPEAFNIPITPIIGIWATRPDQSDVCTD